MAAKPREMNPDAKRAAILEAAEALFAQTGFAETSVSDIAERAHVAVGSLYRLFGDKTGLLAALHRRMEDRFIAAMERGWRQAPGPQGRYGEMVDALLAEAAKTRESMPLYTLTRDLVGETGYRPGERTIERIAALYQNGIDEGLLRPAEPDIVAPMAYGLVDGAMRALAAHPSRHRKIADALTEALNRAFLADRSRLMT